jgi:hypothetical protein
LNDEGQLGDGTYTNRNYPKGISGGAFVGMDTSPPAPAPVIVLPGEEVEVPPVPMTSPPSGVSIGLIAGIAASVCAIAAVVAAVVLWRKRVRQGSSNLSSPENGTFKGQLKLSGGAGKQILTCYAVAGHHMPALSSMLSAVYALLWPSHLPGTGTPITSALLVHCRLYYRGGTGYYQCCLSANQGPFKVPHVCAEQGHDVR